MDPRDVDQNDSVELRQQTSDPTSRRKRGLLFGGLGFAVVAALATVVVIVTGDSGQPANAAGQAPAAPAELSVTLPPSSSAPAEEAQPPGSVRLPDGATAQLVQRELTEDNTLPIPQDLDKATWWGAGLGQSGAMLLSGHINWKGEEGPFKELLRIQPGQQVVVLDDTGAEWTYQVRDVRKVAKEELPAVAPELFGQSGEHRLVLVTCGGDFVGGSTGYSSNVIAIADLEGSPEPA